MSILVIPGGIITAMARVPYIVISREYFDWLTRHVQLYIFSFGHFVKKITVTSTGLDVVMI